MLEVLEQRLNRYTRSLENRRTAQNLRVNRDKVRCIHFNSLAFQIAQWKFPAL